MHYALSIFLIILKFDFNFPFIKLNNIHLFFLDQIQLLNINQGNIEESTTNVCLNMFLKEKIIKK